MVRSMIREQEKEIKRSIYKQPVGIKKIRTHHRGRSGKVKVYTPEEIKQFRERS